MSNMAAERLGKKSCNNHRLQVAVTQISMTVMRGCTHPPISTNGIGIQHLGLPCSDRSRLNRRPQFVDSAAGHFDSHTNAIELRQLLLTASTERIFRKPRKDVSGIDPQALTVLEFAEPHFISAQKVPGHFNHCRHTSFILQQSLHQICVDSDRYTSVSQRLAKMLQNDSLKLSEEGFKTLIF